VNYNNPKERTDRKEKFTLKMVPHTPEVPLEVNINAYNNIGSFN
jgi:hypothetical protein